MVSYSAVKPSLVGGESISKIYFSHFHTTGNTRGTFGEENTITTAEVFLADKTMKTRKAAGCDEI